MSQRRLWLAILIAFLLHGFFILTARYRLSYDAYTHMLFADHYAKDWFSLWETRWYAGFDIVSYPPLTHQLIALFIPLIGFDAAYAFILWLITTLYPLGIYTFSRIFTGKTASSYAALASAVMLPIYVTAHIFGQLPFLTATLFALFGAAALGRFLKEGGLSNFLLAVSVTATTMAAHHATLIIQPFFIFAISVFQFKPNNWKTLFSRLLIYFIAAITAGILVIWPFWKWGLHQQLQTPIDHLSRHNFFTDPLAIVVFFLPFYFPIGMIIPFLFRKWPYRFIGLQFSFVILFILGLGDTTPLPDLLFGKSWEWLTYDRFAFWAALTLTSFFGVLLIRFKRWMRPRIRLNLIPGRLKKRLIPASVFFIFMCSAAGSWFAPILFPTQPQPIEMGPIVDFLKEKDPWSQWRYLTFGFGNQYTYLNLLTTDTTIDGSYHTARTLPELRKSGIAEIDTAYWTLKGVPAIGPILRVSGEYGVRWGFVNRSDYIPELKKNGWEFVKFLDNGIQVWENPKSVMKPVVIPQADPFEAISWGVFPILSLIVTCIFGTLAIRPQDGEGILRSIHTFLIGLLPLGICLWYYKTIFEFDHKQVYFIYDHALFFLSDGLVLITAIFWLAAKARRKTTSKFSPIVRLIFILCVWITLSSLWAIDWRTSLYISAHFWLIFLLILSLQDWTQAYNSVLKGLCVALIFQVVIGMLEFKTQSTQFLAASNLTWPGLLDASTKGAAILKYPGGENFLRVYGTFPHPNILAGFTLICIAGVISLILNKEKTNWPTWILLIFGTSLLAITFSRSAWLGLIVFLLVLLAKSKFLQSKKIWLVFSTILITVVLTLIPLRELVISRTTAPTTTTEEFSLVGRIWLSQQALAYAKEKPFIGIGIGSFVIQLAQRAGENNYVEPVHNIPLLVLCELGIVGLILLIAISFSILREFILTTRSNVILVSALLAGMGTISLFDHYFWSLAPGRIMAGLILGLWLGQVAKDDQ